MTIPFLVTPACAVPAFWAGLHYTTIRIIQAGTYTSARLRLLLYAYEYRGFRTVWTVSCLSSAIAPLGIQSSCDCHLATHTSKHFVLREIAYMPYVRCYKTAFRYACASIMRHLLALHRHKVTGRTRLMPYLGYQGFEERNGFHRSVEFTMPALGWPVNSFFQDSEKIFSEPRQGIKPCQLGMDTIRKSFVPEKAFRVKHFFKFFSHFYLQLFQVLMHIPKIFFKSLTIPASYVFFFCA